MFNKNDGQPHKLERPIEENKFQEADSILSNFQRIIWQEGEFDNLVDRHLEEWLPIMFKATRETTDNSKKLQYANVLNSLVVHSDPSRCDTVLANLMTKRETVLELSRQAGFNIKPQEILKEIFGRVLTKTFKSAKGLKNIFYSKN